MQRIFMYFSVQLKKIEKPMSKLLQQPKAVKTFFQNGSIMLIIDQHCIHVWDNNDIAVNYCTNDRDNIG